jgi:hypothetical protein
MNSHRGDVDIGLRLKCSRTGSEGGIGGVSRDNPAFRSRILVGATFDFELLASILRVHERLIYRGETCRTSGLDF